MIVFHPAEHCVVLDPRESFEGYVVGRGNLLAHAAARHVVEAGGVVLNPLFVHAERGRGKTRLLQALGNEMQGMGRRILFLSGRDFPRVGGIAHRFDALLVDDVDALQGKLHRAHFAHALAAMADTGRQVVLASALPPEALGLEPDGDTMRRIRGGTVVEIGPMDRDQRFAVLRARAGSAPGLSAPDEAVLRAVADRVSGSAGELVAVFDAVAVHLAGGGAPQGAEFERLLAGAGPGDVTLERVQTVVAAFFGVARSEILSRGRMAEVVTPRHVAMYLAKEMTAMSLPEIGRGFGGRDHTTVLHGIRKISDGIVRNRHLADQVDRLRRKLLER